LKNKIKKINKNLLLKNKIKKKKIIQIVDKHLDLY